MKKVLIVILAPVIAVNLIIGMILSSIVSPRHGALDFVRFLNAKARVRRGKHSARLTTVVVGGQEITVTLNGILLLAVVGIPERVPAAAAVWLPDGTEAVVANDLFDKQSDNFKAAVVAHEIGHLVNQDAQWIKDNKIKYMIGRVLGWVPPIEYAADAYAAGVGCNMIGALQMLLPHCDIGGRAEIRKRIKALQQ